jgi:hypothetical protein
MIAMTNDYSGIRAEIEGRFQDVIDRMMETTNQDGLKIILDDKPIIAEFNNMIALVERCYLGDETVAVQT